MRGVNRVTLLGNLGKDPDIRYSQSGTAFASFSLACNESRKQKDGTYSDFVEWVNVVAIGKTAETAGQYLKKGSPVYIEGKLQTRKWQDKDGHDRWTTEVVVSPVGLILLGQGTGNRAPHPSEGESQRGPASNDSFPGPGDGDGFDPYSDVPF